VKGDEPVDYRDEVLRCKLVAQLLIIDGQLTDDERTFLFGLMERLELDEDEKGHVIDSVNVDDPVEDILGRVDSAMRATVLEDLGAAALADGELGVAEQRIIDRVSAAIEGADT
jgi:hypothetical protein